MKPYAFEELPKETLVKLLGAYLRAVMAVDGWWFTGVEQAVGMEKALEIDRFVWERAGRAEGQRLKQALSLGDDATALATGFSLASCPGPTSRLEVEQVFPRDFRLNESTVPMEIVDKDTLRFYLNLAPGEEKTVTYIVTVHHGN